MSTLNSEYTQLINQFKIEVNNITSETLHKLENVINNVTIDDFENKVNTILNEAQNSLTNKQKEFYDSIDSMSTDVSSEIESVKEIIEQKKQEALMQLNKSENSAITRLEETYDTGVATILSAEKTALYNLGILTDKLIEKLKETADSVDITIKNKLKEALKEIEEYSNSLKEEIKETEIQIKENIKAEALKLVAEAYRELENIKVDMKNFAALLKKEMTEHKDLMLEEIRQDKEKFFIEMDREQNRILEVLRLKEYEISTNLNKKEQAIISNIAMVVAGYDRELEVLKQAKLNEFIDALELIVDQTIKDAVNNAEELFKSQVDRIIKEIEDAIMDDTVDAVRKLLDEFSEQRYEIVLPAGKNTIELPKGDFTITNRLKLYLDGILQVREKHYTVDPLHRVIILKRSFPDDIDVIVTEDIPDKSIQTQIEGGLKQLQTKTEESLKEIDDLKNSSIEEIDSLRQESLNQINNTKDTSINEITKTKDESIQEVIKTKEDSITEITNKLPEWIEETRLEIDKISKFYKEDFEKYVEQWREGVYSTQVNVNQSIVLVPPLELVLNRSAKVYFDGILQTLNTHYTVDFLTNSITILNPFSYPIDILILQNIPVTNLPKREATDKEIDDLFLDPYRLGTDKDIDGLYEMKAATDQDVDSLFNK